MSSEGGPGPASRPRIDFADALRAIAALSVVALHARLTVTQGTGHVGGVVGFIGDFLAYGHFGVVAFIAISGYSLAIAVTAAGNRLPRGIKGFAGARARRILPSYYAALLLSLLLIAVTLHAHTKTNWATALPVTAKGVLAHLFLIQDVGPAFQINYPMWSIAVEAQLYLTFPLVIWLRRRYGWSALLAGACVIAFLAFVVLHTTRFSAINPQLFGPFVAGYWAADVGLHADRHPRLVRLPALRLSAGILIAVAITLAIVIPPDNDRSTSWYDIPFGLGIAFLLIGLSRSPQSRARKILERRSLIAIGLFSFSLYLVHAPLLQLLWRYVLHPLNLGPTWELILLETVGTAILVGAAYLFYRLVERPAMSRFKQRTSAAELGRGPVRPRLSQRIRGVQPAPSIKDGLNDAAAG